MKSDAPDDADPSSGDQLQVRTTIARALTDKVSGPASVLLVSAMAILLVAVYVYPVTNISTVAWANWQAPIAIGILAAVLGSYRYFQRRQFVSKGLMALVFVGALSTFACREALQAIGAEMSGTEERINSHVVSLRDGGNRQRCARFATFETPAQGQDEVCIDLKFQTSLVEFPLEAGDEVDLVVTTNALGRWVTAIRQKEIPKDESSNLEQLRKALPGARVEPYDPSQLKNLGPSAVPGILANAELSELRKRALAGDNRATYMLVHHYNLVGNDSESQAWTRVGAENGEYNSMVLMAFDAASKGGIEGCVRSVYWWTRARADLEGDLKLNDTANYRGDIEILIRAANDEIAKAKKQVSGC